jgi:hypothetical protein
MNILVNLECLVRRRSNSEVGNPELLPIASALKENRGLVKLDLWAFRMNHETWDVLCDSLKTHPTLEVLDLRYDFGLQLAPAAITSRIQALLDMLKVNMSIHTLHWLGRYSRHELFRVSVVPYLETNRLRPRLRAIQITRPPTYRAKVLGRALLAARTDPNHFWMLLSGNSEVAFPSTIATIAAAGTLPTSATTSTANVAAISATVAITVTATRADSTTGVSVAAYVAATTTVCQKRKARP